MTLNSAEPVDVTLPVEVDYMCEKKENSIAELCIAKALLKISIHNSIVSFVQYKSINLGIVFTLFTVMLALFLICRYKYRSIKDRAYRELRELTNPQHCQL
jgi:hypothetical protein